MPIRKVKSRVRFQPQQKQVKRDHGAKAQSKPTRTVYGGTSGSTVVDDVVHGKPSFEKKRVRSTDELGNLLHSNLSTTLAAVKASTTQQNTINSPFSPEIQHIEQLQEEGDDPPASFLQLAPIYRPVGECLEATDACAVVNKNDTGGNGRSISLLATTVIHLPVGNRLELKGADAVITEYTAKDDVQSTSLLATMRAVVPAGNHTEAHQFLAIASSATDSCAIGDENDSPASSSVETFAGYTKGAIVRSSTEPLQPQKHQSTFLQRLITLFAGRRRCSRSAKEGPRSASTSLQDQHQVDTTSFSPLHPIHTPRQTTFQVDGITLRPIPLKNLSLAPPILAPCRPYRPLDEHPQAPFIEPAKPHKYTGTYSVTPNIFAPAEIQVGFPSPPSTGPPLAIRRRNSDSRLLDRDETVWGKWYAKRPNPEDLPFAKVHSNNRLHHLAEEITEQQTWDAHRTSLVQPQTVNREHTSDIDMSRVAEDEEQERAARLRNHPGHCFGAVAGDVYPFHGGLII